jgi:hypothetical protein
LEEAQNNQEHHGSDRRRDDQVYEMGKTKVDAQLRQQPIADKGTDNAYAKIGDETKARTAHDLAREPARKNANEDNDEETFTGQGTSFLRFAASHLARAKSAPPGSC